MCFLAKGSIKSSYTYKSKIGYKGGVLGRLDEPSAITIHPTSGDIYVTDQKNHRIQVFKRDGTSPRKFNRLTVLVQPISLAFHPDGDLVVLTWYTELLIFDTEGKCKSQWTGPYRGHEEKQILNPSSLAIDLKGNIVIANPESSQLQVYTKDGEWVKTIGSKGDEIGQFQKPNCVAVDLLGNYIVGDPNAQRITIFDPEGTPIRAFGERGREDHQFSWIMGVYVDQHGHILVTDKGHHQVKIFDREGRYLMKVDRPSGCLGGEKGIAIDQNGDILLVDSLSHCILVFG
jgi:DNA-binding beta-propeller fold protein YncE